MHESVASISCVSSDRDRVDTNEIMNHYDDRFLPNLSCQVDQTWNTEDNEKEIEKLQLKIRKRK